jgi:cupin 2 domain-containing protein
MNNIFNSSLPNLGNEHFDTLVDSDRVRIERIVSHGHTSPETGWYDQPRSEWVMVLRGEAVLAFEDETSVILKAGDYLNIPAHCKHKVAWTTPDQETIWLAVHY